MLFTKISKNQETKKIGKEKNFSNDEFSSICYLNVHTHPSYVLYFKKLMITSVSNKETDVFV